MLIDTHAHVNFKSFEADAQETIQRALDGGVWMVNVGSQIDTSRQCVELANQFEKGVYAVVGLHPEHTHSQYVDEEETSFKSREEVFDYEAYKALAMNPKVVGIGECGLDYYRLPEGANHHEIKEKQRAAFRAQIQLAKELNKALVIHSRPAKDDESLYDDLLAILDNELFATTPSSSGGHPSQGEGSGPFSPPFQEPAPDSIRGGVPRAGSRGRGGNNFRFEVHSFTGSPAVLQKFLDRGAYVSFNGIITFDKTGNMEQLVKMAPLDRIILETDCPYLTPIPHRGKRNEPAYVSYVAQKVAELKGIPMEEIANLSTTNASRLFLIDGDFHSS